MKPAAQAPIIENYCKLLESEQTFKAKIAYTLRCITNCLSSESNRKVHLEYLKHRTELFMRVAKNNPDATILELIIPIFTALRGINAKEGSTDLMQFLQTLPQLNIDDSQSFLKRTCQLIDVCRSDSSTPTELALDLLNKYGKKITQHESEYLFSFLQKHSSQLPKSSSHLKLNMSIVETKKLLELGRSLLIDNRISVSEVQNWVVESLSKQPSNYSIVYLAIYVKMMLDSCKKVKQDKPQYQLVSDRFLGVFMSSRKRPLYCPPIVVDEKNCEISQTMVAKNFTDLLNFWAYESPKWLTLTQQPLKPHNQSKMKLIQSLYESNRVADKDQHTFWQQIPMSLLTIRELVDKKLSQTPNPQNGYKTVVYLKQRLQLPQKPTEKQSKTLVSICSKVFSVYLQNKRHQELKQVEDIVRQLQLDDNCLLQKQTDCKQLLLLTLCSREQSHAKLSNQLSKCFNQSHLTIEQKCYIGYYAYQNHDRFLFQSFIQYFNRQVKEKPSIIEEVAHYVEKVGETFDEQQSLWVTEEFQEQVLERLIEVVLIMLENPVSQRGSVRIVFALQKMGAFEKWSHSYRWALSSIQNSSFEKQHQAANILDCLQAFESIVEEQKEGMIPGNVTKRYMAYVIGKWEYFNHAQIYSIERTLGYLYENTEGTQQIQGDKQGQLRQLITHKDMLLKKKYEGIDQRSYKALIIGNAAKVLLGQIFEQPQIDQTEKFMLKSLKEYLSSWLNPVNKIQSSNKQLPSETRLLLQSQSILLWRHQYSEDYETIEPAIIKAMFNILQTQFVTHKLNLKEIFTDNYDTIIQNCMEIVTTLRHNENLLSLPLSAILLQFHSLQNYSNCRIVELCLEIIQNISEVNRKALTKFNLSGIVCQFLMKVLVMGAEKSDSENVQKMQENTVKILEQLCSQGAEYGPYTHILYGNMHYVVEIVRSQLCIESCRYRPITIIFVMNTFTAYLRSNPKQTEIVQQNYKYFEYVRHKYISDDEIMTKFEELETAVHSISANVNSETKGAGQMGKVNSVSKMNPVQAEEGNGSREIIKKGSVVSSQSPNSVSSQQNIKQEKTTVVKHNHSSQSTNSHTQEPNDHSQQSNHEQEEQPESPELQDNDIDEQPKISMKKKKLKLFLIDQDNEKTRRTTPNKRNKAVDKPSNTTAKKIAQNPYTEQQRQMYEHLQSKLVKTNKKKKVKQTDNSDKNGQLKQLNSNEFIASIVKHQAVLNEAIGSLSKGKVLPQDKLNAVKECIIDLGKMVSLHFSYCRRIVSKGIVDKVMKINKFTKYCLEDEVLGFCLQLVNKKQKKLQVLCNSDSIEFFMKVMKRHTHFLMNVDSDDDKKQSQRSQRQMIKFLEVLRKSWSPHQHRKYTQCHFFVAFVLLLQKKICEKEVLQLLTSVPLTKQNLNALFSNNYVYATCCYLRRSTVLDHIGMWIRVTGRLCYQQEKAEQIFREQLPDHAYNLIKELKKLGALKDLAYLYGEMCEKSESMAVWCLKNNVPKLFLDFIQEPECNNKDSLQDFYRFFQKFSVRCIEKPEKQIIMTKHLFDINYHQYMLRGLKNMNEHHMQSKAFYESLSAIFDSNSCPIFLEEQIFLLLLNEFEVRNYTAIMSALYEFVKCITELPQAKKLNEQGLCRSTAVFNTKLKDDESYHYMLLIYIHLLQNFGLFDPFFDKKVAYLAIRKATFSLNIEGKKICLRFVMLLCELYKKSFIGANCEGLLSTLLDFRCRGSELELLLKFIQIERKYQRQALCDSQQTESQKWHHAFSKKSIIDMEDNKIFTHILQHVQMQRIALQMNGKLISADSSEKMRWLIKIIHVFLDNAKNCLRVYTFLQTTFENDEIKLFLTPPMRMKMFGKMLSNKEIRKRMFTNTMTHVNEIIAYINQSEEYNNQQKIIDENLDILVYMLRALFYQVQLESEYREEIIYALRNNKQIKESRQVASFLEEYRKKQEGMELRDLDTNRLMQGCPVHMYKEDNTTSGLTIFIRKDYKQINFGPDVAGFVKDKWRLLIQNIHGTKSFEDKKQFDDSIFMRNKGFFATKFNMNNCLIIMGKNQRNFNCAFTYLKDKKLWEKFIKRLVSSKCKSCDKLFS